MVSQKCFHSSKKSLYRRNLVLVPFFLLISNGFLLSCHSSLVSPLECISNEEGTAVR